MAASSSVKAALPLPVGIHIRGRRVFHGERWERFHYSEALAGLRTGKNQAVTICESSEPSRSPT